jgi:phenylalanyl-tRNA synthetase beta subunit
MSMELKKAIDQISKDRGIDRDLLIDTLEEAVRSSVARKYGDHLDFEVGYNEEQGEIEVYQFKVVVEEVDLPDSEITWKRPARSIPTSNSTTRWGSSSKSRIWAASRPSPPSR